MCTAATTIDERIEQGTTDAKKMQVRGAQCDLKVPHKTVTEELVMLHAETRYLSSQLDSQSEVFRGRSLTESVPGEQPLILLNH